MARRMSEHENPGHTCKGTSILHNFLPILEPLVLVDPRLKTIEDRILGRQAVQSGKSHRVPSSIDELRLWMKEEPSVCDCDECAPWLYQLDPNSSHGAIRYTERDRSSLLRPFLELPISLPKLKLRLYGEHEATRFVRHHIAWLDKTYMHTVLEKDLNVLRLRSLLQCWNPNLTGQDMRQTMSSPQMLHLIKLLNKVFFFDALPRHRDSISDGFSWLPETNTACFGIGTYNALIGTQVLLHPKLYRHHGDLNDPDVRWRNRLGTLLHELSHAFLKAYTCRSCPSHDLSIGARGHGRAWQLLAAKLEQVATRILDGFVDFGRYPSMLHELQASGKLPSAHDLDVLNFGTRWPAAT
ncbi:hypothetical protein ACEQ8H_005457 [Pleosporales sp. CAS-2024a]